MAPTPTPSSKSVQSQATPSKTPQSKHRTQLNFAKSAHPSPNPAFTTRETPPAEHPVEVVGRIRDYPDRKDKPISALQISAEQQSIRVRTDIGYRDFSLDGVSISEEEDLDGFYKRFVESRINDVKLGAKCTIMTYGPTGSGKSHTMFGCSKQPGIVYRAMRDILGERDEEKNADSQRLGVSSFVQVTVLEIYNEEIYDLLSNNNGGGLNFGWPKGNTTKVRLEVMGKKAKNAAFIYGNEAGKISKEVAKVEKRRIVKSTQCNDRSSRSHCMIILDVPSVGGRLMLVDMAGSENIDQAGQIGYEAKMQTAKINQGNIALKRVVESIANGDSHVPFRDSKLTMLLQDSFEDDKSKILMILCASPDPKEIHKTISTLEYGAKAKCIVRGPHTPTKEKVGEHSSSEVVLGSRIAAMDQFIFKLQMENKLREKERNEAQKELLRKEEEVAALRTKLELMEGRTPVACEEEINVKVNERTHILKIEIEKKLQECQKMANEFVELGRRRMEEKFLQQKKEVEMLRQRLEEIESELCQLKDTNIEGSSLRESDGSRFAKRLLEIYADGDRGMDISMELDMGDKQPIVIHEVKEINEDVHLTENYGNYTLLNSLCSATKENEKDEDIVFAPKFTEKVCLSTVFEDEEEDEENTEEEEVEKEIVEETALHVGRRVDSSSRGIDFDIDSFLTPNLGQKPISYYNDMEKADYNRDRSEEKSLGLGLMGELEDSNDAASARRTRIQNIFMLCGNHRELAQHVKIPTPAKERTEAADVRSSPVMMFDKESFSKTVFKEISPLQTVPMSELDLRNKIVSNITTKNTTGIPNSAPLEFSNEQKLIEAQISKSQVSSEIEQELKENSRPEDEYTSGLMEVYVKWEASKENPGKFITKLKVARNSSLADLRKLIETHLGKENSKQAFTFLMLRDPTGAPVVKEKESTLKASELPICNNHLSGHLACLRPVKAAQRPSNLPFSSLENKLQIVSNSPSVCMKNVNGFSPEVGHNISPAPCVPTTMLHMLIE